jgi:isoleucyl-tRNA synthetase
VRVLSAPEDLPGLLAAKRELLATLFIVSRVDLHAGERRSSIVYESQDIPGLVIGVDRAPGDKCERCWTRTEDVGQAAAHPTLCARCVRVVTGSR